MRNLAIVSLLAAVAPTRETDLLEPPPELEGLALARWYYQLLARSAVDPERQKRRERVEQKFWRRDEEILAGDYRMAGAGNRPDEPEKAQPAAGPASMDAGGQAAVPPAMVGAPPQPLSPPASCRL